MPPLSPGSLVRWQAPGTSGCMLGGASWNPIGDTCWFAIDLLTPEGPLELGRTRAGVDERVTVAVAPYPYPQQSITVEPEMVHAPQHELARIEREQRRVAALWERSGPARFSLPLLPPLDPMPAGRSFGACRIINGEARSPHFGLDFASPAGTVVHAASRGEVVLAGELYFAGNAVFIDHGDQLFTMYFHLRRIAVQEGADVQAGQPIGTVGATGRATGPHLHFSVRWHGARVDPQVLLSDPELAPKIAGPAGPWLAPG